MSGKSLFLLLLPGFCLLQSPVAAQERSPRIIIEWEFRDKDGNQLIDPKEKVLIVLKLKNVGDARANYLMLNVTETNGIQGLEYESEFTLGRHSINAMKEVEIPVTAGPRLQSGEANFLLEVHDRSGYRAEPLSLLVQCRGTDDQASVREAVVTPVAQPRAASESSAQEKMRGVGDPLKGLNVSSPRAEMHFGNYYALIIGIDHYRGFWTPLNNAVRDAKAIENTLKSKYKFDHFRTLYNEEATRARIIREMEWLVDNVDEEDNVFIYFSGHGDFKQELNKGYWVPYDATTESVSNYISNNDIQTFLGGIRSKHTLLVADACFSGDIFRGKTVSIPFENSERYYSTVHNLLSRQALTSGGIEPVMDGGRDGHSVFAYYLLKALENNNDLFFDASQLFNSIRIPVINNSEQSPSFQPIKNTGDEGGQFIFLKKQ
ncbi:MAG: caspase family protein [Bacteroidales bacterium]